MTDAIARLSAALADRYAIEHELGAGGMATVYLAHDVRHDRKVALKVLRPELSAILGGERFLHEIKTTANLQHPHILSLFDSGEADGLVYYVMPYVEGESLRDRLTRDKQLPVEEAVRIAREVADALQYAHQHGIVHRDIKPENILLHGGHAQVADFGIALAASRSEGGTRMTETGMSLGTPQYMAPEQAMGDREVTAKADIYALGCVLYEALSGEAPFTGPTPQAIVARIMTEQPRSLASQRHTVPAHVEDAVMMALEKLPADRFASAAEFAAALGGAGTEARWHGGTAAQALSPRTALPPNRRAALPWVLTLVAGVAAVWGWLRPRVPADPAHPSRLAILASGLGGSGGPSLQRQIALTPDGRSVLFVSVAATGANVLFRQSLDATQAVPIPIASGAVANPVVAPDGRWLVVSDVQTLRIWRVPIEGGAGAQLPLSYTAGGSQSAWDGRGNLWTTVGAGNRHLVRLTPDDSLTEFPEPIGEARLMQVLQGDETALVLIRAAGTATGTLQLLDLDTRRLTGLMNVPVVEARYAAGHLVYALGDGSLMAVPFDVRRHRVTGNPVTIATGVSLTGTGLAQFAVAPNGTVAYIPEEPRSLVFVDRAGVAREATAERRNFHAPQFSPDGRRLSVDFTSSDGRDVWILALDQGTLSRATFDRDGHDATWMPDGRLLTYISAKTGFIGIYRTRPGSAEPAESLLTSPNLSYTGQWLRGGSAVVTTGNGLRGNSLLDVAIVRNAGRGPIEPLVASQFTEHYPAVSPDGRWLAYASNQSGQEQVYLQPLGGSGDILQVSLTGGNEPVWSRDGRSLYYRAVNGGQVELTEAVLRMSPEPGVVSRRSLFSAGDYVGTQPHANYDVTPDGRGFVMVRRSTATRVMVIQNLPALVGLLRGTPAAGR